MQRQGKRARIPIEAKALIGRRALEVPRLQRGPLAEKLQAELKDLGYDVPQYEVLERMISKYRTHTASSPEDMPWSTATLNAPGAPPLPQEALAAVLRVWQSRIEKGAAFTIREAKWTARLSGLEPDIEKLSFIARRHARTEQMFELIDRAFDSTFLDQLLMHELVDHDFDSTAEQQWLLDLSPTWDDLIVGVLPLLAMQEDGVDQLRDAKAGRAKDTYASYLLLKKLAGSKRRPSDGKRTHPTTGEGDVGGRSESRPRPADLPV